MSLAYRVSAFNRTRKWWRFQELFPLSDELRILDVGYSNEEYSDTDNFLEKHYPWPEQITALGVEPTELFSQRYPRVRAIEYDGREFPFDDDEFDLCWSNAVIEHVGSRERQALFLSEIRRVSRAAYVTTPNRLFPIEVHTRTPLLHFLPKRVFDGYLRRVGMEWAAGDYMNLLSRGDLIRMLAAIGVQDYQIHANRLGPFALDFVMSWAKEVTGRRLPSRGRAGQRSTSSRARLRA